MKNWHKVSLDNRKEMLDWLHNNIQHQMDPILERRGERYLEWKSLDGTSWLVRQWKSPPKLKVLIKDKNFEMMFMLRWS